MRAWIFSSPAPLFELASRRRSGIMTLLVASATLGRPAATDVAGVLAQLVERLVRNEKVRGSNPLDSTIRVFSLF